MECSICGYDTSNDNLSIYRHGDGAYLCYLHALADMVGYKQVVKLDEGEDEG